MDGPAQLPSHQHPPHGAAARLPDHGAGGGRPFPVEQVWLDIQTEDTQQSVHVSHARRRLEEADDAEAQSHFQTVFKQITRETPMAYRRGSQVQKIGKGAESYDTEIAKSGTGTGIAEDAGGKSIPVFREKLLGEQGGGTAEGPIFYAHRRPLRSAQAGQGQYGSDDGQRRR